MTTHPGLYTTECIRTFSGIYLNISSIKPTDIMPVDIAYGLARECRFGNHTKKNYSVAEHSIWCMQKGMELYPNDFALHFRLLMHDAHEAYLGDWCTPMVDAMNGIYPGLKDSVNAIKKMIQHSINQRFGISICPLTCGKVKEIDHMALEWEWDNKVIAWTGFQPLPDYSVADMFIHYFKELVKVPVVIGKAA